MWHLRRASTTAFPAAFPNTTDGRRNGRCKPPRGRKLCGQAARYRYRSGTLRRRASGVARTGRQLPPETAAHVCSGFSIPHRAARAHGRARPSADPWMAASRADTRAGRRSRQLRRRLRGGCRRSAHSAVVGSTDRAATGIASAPQRPLQYVRKQTPSVAIDSGGRYGAMQPSRASDEGALGVTWMCQSEHYEGAGWSGCWLENRTILTPPARAGDGGGRCRLLQRPGSAGGRAPRAIARGTADASADLCALENGP